MVKMRNNKGVVSGPAGFVLGRDRANNLWALRPMVLSEMTRLICPVGRGSLFFILCHRHHPVAEDIFMGIWELCLLGVGLAMDAFAVSICKGLTAPRLTRGQALITGLYFGVFQALMPLVGYLLGRSLAGTIAQVDHWIAFALLAFLGLRMVRQSRQEAETLAPSFGPRAMVPLAVATSIDAMAVGITFPFLQVPVGLAMGLIGGITFLLSVAAVFLGHAFGARWRVEAQVVGGVILLLMGCKILLEHLDLLG